MATFYKVVRSTRRIKRNAVLADRRREIMRDYIRLLFRMQTRRKRRDSGGIDRVLGLRVKHPHCKTMYRLFTEVFVDLDYHFKSQRDTPFIIDCGSNIGMSILFFKTCYPHARVVGFEPDKDAFALLEENLKTNDIDDVIVHRKGIWSSAGKQQLYIDPATPGSMRASLVEGRGGEHTTEIETVALSSYIDQEVDFLKMDIEGAETAVLTELADAGKLSLIKEMAIEYHHHIRDDEKGLSHALLILENAGFGYQLSVGADRSYEPGAFQDILIRAYREHGP